MVSPYSYAYVGRPDRIAEVVFGVKTYSFSPGRGGVAGNIDSGGECGVPTSARFIMPNATSALGELEPTSSHWDWGRRQVQKHKQFHDDPYW